MLMEIRLQPAEQILRELLLECARNFPGLEIWVTGGWVRDRLLGIPSSDLDFSLSNVTGRVFGQFLEAYSARPDIERKYKQRAVELGVTGSTFTRFHIMQKNADMSKKLETAGGNIFGLDIDLVNLRKEVYDGHSRTPDMDFGTPEEDAFRRDATVNSLFFHLEQEVVVDLTGRGLQDLESKIMVTPLDPRQTFMDDPLRVLRIIRIGCKLGFAIDSEVLRCMKDVQIHEALGTMVTRDRVGIEVSKMMKDPRPVNAFRYIFSSNLYTPVFVRPSSDLIAKLHEAKQAFGLFDPLPGLTAWPRAFHLLDSLLRGFSDLSRVIRLEANVEYLWAMAAYAPFAELRRTDLDAVVREAAVAIRVPAKISKLLKAALENFDHIYSIASTVMGSTRGPNQGRWKPQLKSLAGMAIRSWGSTWTTQLTFVLLSRTFSGRRVGIEAEKRTVPDPAPTDDVDRHDLKVFEDFAAYVWQQELQNAYMQRPVLDGNDILRVFDLERGGKFLKTAIDGLLEWQFEHSHGTIEEAKSWLLANRKALGIPSNSSI